LSESSAVVKRREAKREAARIATSLVQIAAETAPSDRELARLQAALARRIALKFNVRLDWRLKRFYCRGCKELLYPGINARVRLGPRRTLLITCTDCKHLNRKKLGARLNRQRKGLSKPARE
jgi:RNase P subunit RPR2